MAVQEAVANTLADLSGNAAALFVGVVAIAVLALGADQILQVFDAGLPWRQIIVGRTLQVLALSSRSFHAIAGSYVTAMLAPRKPGTGDRGATT